MENLQCLLCLEKLTSSTSIKISSLCGLLILSYPSHYNDDNSSQQNILSQFEDKHEICALCGECALVTNEMEEIRQEIANLEDRLRSNAAAIRAKLLYHSESESSDLSNQVEFQHIFEIRESLLHLTDDRAGDNERELEEIEIKIEPEEGDLETPGGEEFLEEGSGWAQMEEGKVDDGEEPFLQPDEDSESESAFYITPDHIGKSKSKRMKLQGNSRITKLQQSGANKDKKRSTKSIKPVNIKRESRPRTAKTLLISKTDGGVGEKLIQVNLSRSVRHGKTKHVVIAKTARNKVGSTPEIKNKIDPRPYKCKSNSCSRSFRTEDLLTQHVEWDHRFPCRLCEAKFPSQKSRNTHLKKKHKTTYAYECNICSKQYAMETLFGAHMLRHETGDKILSCSNCDKKFSLQVNLDRHLQLHLLEPNKSLSCDVCDARFCRQEGLDKHLKTHDKAIACETCCKICACRDVLRSHMRLHTGERPYKCDHCDETFIRPSSVQAHFLRVHGGSVPSHACTYCEKKLFTLSGLKTHMDSHEGKTKFACDKCGEKFGSAPALKSHQIRAHDESKFTCEECGASFLTIRGFKDHQLMHTRGKPFKCDTCGVSFALKRFLDTHKITHTDERPYTCERCGKGFRTTTDLSRHVKRIHTKDYVIPIKHNCPDCGKGYPTNFLMQAHIRSVHTGERPFLCHLCGKGFAIKTVLTLHLKGTHKLQVQGLGRKTVGKSKRDDFSGKE